MRRVALLVAAVLLLGVTVAPTPVAAQSGPSKSVITIQVRPDGDARWSVATRFVLGSESEQAAFERLRSDFLARGGAHSGAVSVFDAAAAQGARRTGTNMTITTVSRSANVKSENGSSVGVLTVSFTWTNFATADGSSIAVGRAFEGGWFGDLGPEQTLVIEPPEGYQVHSARPSTDIVAGALHWEGPQTFGPGEPSIQFVPGGGLTTGGPGPEPGIPWLYPAIGFIVLILGGTVLLAWRGGYVGSTESDGETAGPDEPGSAAVEPVEPVEKEPGEGEVAAVDTELLSDEERVEHLLEQHDGRMKQARIVEETRWSNAKVSQLLSSMAEAGRIEKLRIGRENLISLPTAESDEDPGPERD